ncbi:MAG: DUF4124 domain-containing protein [Arenicella sp.]
MMIKKVLTISLTFLLVNSVSLALPMAANAQVQKCRDAQGKWHYGNDLSNVCANEADIKQVKERVTSGSNTSSGISASESELTRLELKVLNRTEYRKSDLEKILAPYKTEKDVQQRFNRLRDQTTQQRDTQQKLADALQEKQQRLAAGREKQTSEAAVKEYSVKLADNKLRLDSSQAEIRELNKQLDQIEKRRAKVVSLFNQFKDSPDSAEKAKTQAPS